MKLTLERAPWHTVKDSKARYKYDAIVEVHGVTMRTCRLGAKQVTTLVRAGVPVIKVPCRLCKKIRCWCPFAREYKPRRETHVGRK